MLSGLASWECSLKCCLDAINFFRGAASQEARHPIVVRMSEDTFGILNLQFRTKSVLIGGARC